MNTMLCMGQRDFRSEFARFAESSRKEFDEFDNLSKQSFAQALRSNWESFHVFSERTRGAMMPPVAADSTATPISDERVEIDSSSVEDRQDVPGAMFTSTDAVATANLSATRRVDFKVFGYPVFVNVPLSYSEIGLKDVREKSVADTWDHLFLLDDGILVCDLHSLISRLNLNDWGSYMLVRSCASAIFHSADLQTVASVYWLNDLGLDCRIARVGKSLLPLFKCEQPVYARKYIQLGGSIYYIDGDMPLEDESLQTYSFPSWNKIKALNLELSAAPLFYESSGLFVHSWHTSVLEGDIDVSIDNCILNFYDSYPQTIMPVYARTAPEKNFSNTLIETLSERVKGMSRADAVRTILKMMHQDFGYKVDSEQFGYEKVFFCEENFKYEYNDCEDRAILFSYLVRSLLGLNVVMLEYPDHVNCAVAVDGVHKGQYVELHGRRYYVCDPTYIGADIGMSPVPATTKPNKVWVL